jgi:AcrR family transcriptional regulator
MTGEPRRPHTGRRRNEAARDAILDATFELLRSGAPEDLTIDAIAAAAGTGRQTIYRWWPGKTAVIAEAMERRGRQVAPVRDTGDFTADLTAFVTDSFAGLDEPVKRTLRTLGGAAQQDEKAAELVQDFTAGRRAALRGPLARGVAAGQISAAADLDVLVDMMYGVLWYRVLISHAPTSEAAARSLARHLIAAGRSVRPGEVQHDDARDDQGDPHHLRGGDALVQEEHGDDRDRGGAHAGPDGIADPDVKAALDREGQQDDRGGVAG